MADQAGDRPHRQLGVHLQARSGLQAAIGEAAMDRRAGVAVKFGGEVAAANLERGLQALDVEPLQPLATDRCGHRLAPRVISTRSPFSPWRKGVGEAVLGGGGEDVAPGSKCWSSWRS